MYFIMEGAVGVGYRYSDFGRQYRLIKNIRERQYICDYYVCARKRSEFLYVAVKELKTYAL